MKDWLVCIGVVKEVREQSSANCPTASKLNNNAKVPSNRVVSFHLHLLIKYI